MKDKYRKYLEIYSNAEHGCHKSQFKLSKIYFRGDVFQKNDELGLYYLKKSAKQKNSAK